MRPRNRFLIAAALAATVACDDSSTPTDVRRPVATVTLAPIQGTVWAGTARQLVAVPKAADGTPLLDRVTTWTSSEPAVATINGAGRLEALAAGATRITATSEGKQAELTVTVSEADLAYEGYRTGLPELFTLSLRGGEPTRLLPPYTLVTDPKLSPDGSKIAFVIADYESATGDIWVINRDGTALEQLTFDSEMDDQPAWSPDGTRIAFRSFRTQRQGDIWVMNADGTNLVNLTPDPLPGITDELQPAWSPDGKRIAYGSTAGGNMDLWTMRADGTDKQRLTTTTEYDTEPTWSPDGLRIAFRRSSDEYGSDLAFIDATGGTVTRVPHEGNDVAPAWSPDGRFIAFSVHPPGGGSPQIFTMHADGTEITLRTTDYRWNGGRNPSWVRSEGSGQDRRSSRAEAPSGAAGARLRADEESCSSRKRGPSTGVVVFKHDADCADFRRRTRILPLPGESMALASDPPTSDTSRRSERMRG